MGNVAVGQAQSKGQMTISDLTSKYQQKIDNYNLMIGLMNEEQKKIFQIAINLYDIQLRQDHWDSYVGYALNALARSGWYYNIMTQQWQVCQTPETFIKPDPKVDDERAYELYLESLYPRQACQMLGVSRWEIIDRTPDMNSVKLALGGEMSYEELDLDFNVEYYEVGGEQKKSAKAKNKVVRPEIPISPNIDVDELTKGDNSKDKFIYAYTDSGLSKNKRNWRPMIMDRIAQQVMDQNPPGNMGHVNPKNVGYELPLPVVTWIGATTVLLPDGTKRLWLKGYIIPTADGVNLKTYIRAKAINSISVYGGLTLLPNAETGTQDVLDIDLKSIDISGKLKEGLNSGITELAGEMTVPQQSQMQNSLNNEEREETEMADLSKVTLADIKTSNPQLFGEMKAAIIEDMKMEESQKVIMTKAGEMDTLTSQMGGNPMEMFKQYQTFAGEMAAAVGMAPATGAQLPTMAEIGAKVKEVVGNLGKLTTIINPAKDQTVEAKAQELVQQNQLAQNTKAVQDANAKFAELTKDITNEAVKNLVAMNFSGILQAKPEALPEGYATSSIQTLEAQVPGAIQNVVANAQTLMQNGQAAGEMMAFSNLGVGSGAGSNSKSVDQMTDQEYAQSLGYEF